MKVTIDLSNETEKEAIRIFNRFYLSSKSITKSQAKAFSIICIEETIKACEYNKVETYNTDWWNIVKEKIQKIK